MTHNLAQARGARRRPSGLGRRQGQCLRPRHRERGARLRRRRWTGAARGRRGAARRALRAGASRFCCSRACSIRATSTRWPPWISPWWSIATSRSRCSSNCRPPQPVKVYLKFDTGMNRLGFAPARAAAARARVAALPHAAVLALDDAPGQCRSRRAGRTDRVGPACRAARAGAGLAGHLERVQFGGAVPASRDTASRRCVRASRSTARRRWPAPAPRP